MAFQQAVDYLPDDARAHFYLGKAYREQEEWQAALEAFTEADKRHPNDAAIMAYRGSMQFQLSGGKRGKELLNQALRIDTRRHQTLLDLALVYITEKDFVAASLCARQALHFQPGDERAQDTLYTTQELRYRFEDRAKIDSIRRSLPRTRKDWQRWISTVTSPSELMASLTEHTPPDSQAALQALGQRAMQEWNRCPRPELGGLSPEQVHPLSVFERS